jgi:hypothetical protein
MRTTVRTALLALALGGIFAARVARADDEQTRRQIFEQARSAMSAGRWQEARAGYQRLWNDRHTYDVALQLGQAEYNLKHLRDAAEHLAYGLMLLPPREKPETVERSRQLLAACRPSLGALDLRVKNQGADIIVDTKLVAEAPLVTEIFVEPGEHRFEVRLDGHASEAFTVRLDAGQTKTRVVELKPIVTSAATAEPAPRRPKPARPRFELPDQPPPLETHASWAPVVVGGLLTVAGLSAGLGFQLVRNARESEANRIRSNLGSNSCSQPPVGDCQRLVELASDYDSFGKLELLSFVVGGVALVGTGTYFFVARPDQSKAASARLGPLHFGAHVAKGSGTLRVTAAF